MTVHVITGGTGFVGAAIILELLCQTDADVLCLVHSEKNDDIDARLYQALHKAAQAYGYDRHIIDLAQKRCSALAGDLNIPYCGCAPSTALGPVEHFWHCAASLKYEDEYQEEIYGTNVLGTQHALDLAMRLHAQCFNYISTAYVAGKRSGVIREELFDEGHEFNHNYYERSKCQAELLVAHTTDFQTHIFRPSTVVGHSRTYAVSGRLTGPYLLAQRLGKLKEVLAYWRVGNLLTEPPRLCADPQCSLNMIPVDLVARQAVFIARSSPTPSVFHLTNATPPTIGTLITSILRVLEFKAPVFVSSREDFTMLDEQMAQIMDFFTPYLVGQQSFDRSRSNAVLGDEHAGEVPLDETMLERYIRWSTSLLPAA
jgi:thioester reductase-like protein